ncbi:glycosyltransferase family 2 protein [Calothrix sp. CCY 0018]|uniref:glycosyltransferase family 2 protein n=1 Tax=Calothrix sp. CCY 0018 TaxID=3103864 RepID=UPI0039C62925
MRVAVCIITCQRSEGLKRLLNGLNKLKFKLCEQPSLEIIVVDNDENCSARQLCCGMNSQIKWTLKYCVEPRRGIPFARNKAINCAGESFDFIAFIDDDEVPQTSWLDQLLHVQSLYSADVVAGPVLPYFHQSVPNWIIKGEFFERLRYSTGHIIEGAATNNVLICREVLQKLQPCFDERLALTGGSDWHFFRRVFFAGYKMVWANDALVSEWIPASRANLVWLLKRNYRLGITESFCEVELNPSVLVRATCIFKGIRRIIKGTLFIPLSLIWGKHEVFQTLRYIYHSAGMLVGITGKKYQEYEKIHQV